ncbi:P-loop NTPase fold protein [Clostridium butyricum]|uniref:P-loop NTPase fold protein n=1 Tax=Clostridium butyricum TaxID=1492 RepID=UPI0013CF62A2|nr:P-loop NTPase fold protein [Clostridium butyricum]MCQ2019497.1 hypothetical protein [Clostridium butyricum]UTY53013.1 hypothetical protein HNS01_07870 [Clostridium butyricum]
MKIISMINKVILSLIISSVVFLTLKESVDINMYAILTVLILILIGINFNMKKSRDMYDTFAAIYLGTTLSFFCIKIIWNINSIDELKKSCFNISWIVVIVVILCILVYLFIGSFMGKSKNSIDLTLELIPKRKNDLERIVEYLTRLNIVCLNAKWGDGKTFLVNNLKEQIKDDYEIIEIDVLSCNLEEIQLVLIKELEKVMIRNRIASKYSKKLSDFLGSEFRFKSMWSINFNENISYLDMINGFKNDLKNLTKKKVLIIYEDIDRIKDMQIIKNIFSISEKISRDTNNIKILYQYDEKNLLDIGFKNDYLEKYMPYKINLTRLNFFEVLKFVLDQMKIEENILKFKDFEFLKYSQQIGNFNILYECFKIENNSTINIQNYSIRKVEHFFNEIIFYLDKNNSCENDSEKQIIIVFFILKHFFMEEYNKIEPFKSILDTIKFTDRESKKYSIMDLISLYKSGEITYTYIKDIFNNPDNIEKYTIIRMFNYKINNDEIENDNIFNKSTKKLENEEYNEKIDRIIWNLMESGRSNKTDNEVTLVELVNRVLKKPEEERKEGYFEFDNYFFNLDYNEVDNETTSFMGEPRFSQAFRALSLSKDKDKILQYQRKLIDLYFEAEKIEEQAVSKNVLRIMKYWSLFNRDEYIYILKRFNKIQVKGNLNNDREFIDFIDKYVGALSKQSTKYCNTRGLINIRSLNNINENKAITLKIINDIKEEIVKMGRNIKEYLGDFIIIDELNVIEEFLDKLICIINQEE